MVKIFALYSGDDATAREFIQAGGNGSSVTANIAAKVDICVLML